MGLIGEFLQSIGVCFFLGNGEGNSFISSVHFEGSMGLLIIVALTGVSAVIYREAASPRIRWLRIGQFPTRVFSIHFFSLAVAIDLEHIVRITCHWVSTRRRYFYSRRDWFLV